MMLAVAVARRDFLNVFDVGAPDGVLRQELGEVPQAIGHRLPASFDHLAGGRKVEDFALWAVHPGGRSVLDAVERGLELPPTALDASRSVLRRFGNMSSPTIVFVLKDILASGAAGAPGCALAFGPGLTAESLVFRVAR